MKILMVNKFLYPHGGSETYVFDLGRQLTQMGHEVEYFGMDSKDRIVGNRVESYTAAMDFHASGVSKLLYPFKIIYSLEARKKIRAVLKDFQPDVVHLNNINFQLTPSIIDEIRKWEKAASHKVRIVYTAHDAQWVCPNHLLMIPETKELCMRCREGRYAECTKHRCIHNSKVKSVLGTLEAVFYKWRKTYTKVDTVICPSHFMKEVLSANPSIADRLVVMHNYCAVNGKTAYEKKDYVLYFGRYSEEKGIGTLLQACRELPEIDFVFAGDGSLRAEVESLPNVKNLGFLQGEELYKVIGEAQFVVIPSIWYENCPFTVIESQCLGTPVLGSDLGGIPELIDVGQTGELFEAGNVEQLSRLICSMWNDRMKCRKYSQNCYLNKTMTLQQYCERMVQVYGYERNIQ